MRPLPEGTRLLHIGPHKTGTTTLQAAFHQNRESLATQGVHYAGPTAQPMNAAMYAALGKGVPGGGEDDSRRLWDELVDEVRESDARQVVISSEFFCEAGAKRARKIVTAMGPRTHVVVTLRPLVRILASQWQQYMQNQFVFSFEEWLHGVLDEDPDRSMTPSFWKRHRHDLLVERWAEAVGHDHLTIVVLDESDKGSLMRTFEGMLGLDEGTLVPHDTGANRSLTWAEVETLRAFNRCYRDEGWSSADYTRLVRFGAARHLQARTPAEGEEPVLTPEWAVERTVRIAAEMNDRIRASGLAVVGDLGRLADPTLAVKVGTNTPVDAVPAELAARLSAGVVEHLAAQARRTTTRGRAGDIERRVVRRAEVARAVEQRDRADLLVAQDDMYGPTRAAWRRRAVAARELLRRASLRVGRG